MIKSATIRFSRRILFHGVRKLRDTGIVWRVCSIIPEDGNKANLRNVPYWDTRTITAHIIFLINGASVARAWQLVLYILVYASSLNSGKQWRSNCWSVPVKNCWKVTGRAGHYYVCILVFKKYKIRRRDGKEWFMQTTWFPPCYMKKNFAQRGARTHDPEIKSLMLYRLS